jgi:aminopeptidase YwaD
MKHYPITAIVALLVLASCASSRLHTTTNKNDLLATEKYLTSSALAGRATGSEGDSLARIFIRSELKEAGLKPLVDNGFEYFQARVPYLPDNADSLSHKMVTTANVAMVLEGSDPKLKSEYVIIGAHFDHLGMGGPASSSRNRDTVAIHPGADDNASGVTLMIEMAKRLASQKKGFPRSIVFVAFSGEELGLLGSRYFDGHMPLKPSAVNIMINLDMVGRMKEGNFLQVGGVGTAAGLRDSVAAQVDTSLLHITFTDEGSGPSDHFSFYADSIPVLFFTTGTHSDYHLPSDTYDKLNYDGMVITSDLLYRIIARAATSANRYAFQLSGPQVQQPMGKRGGVTLGIMPDVAGVVKNGLRADLVTPGKPAALGGMKKGDIIISIENKPVSDIYEYMKRLAELKPGQRITVEVLRNGNKEILIIQL